MHNKYINIYKNFVKNKNSIKIFDVFNSIKKFINNKNIDSYYVNSINNTISSLQHTFDINVENYPHSPPYNDILPYIPSLYSIEKIMVIMEPLFINEKYKHYHSNRYLYHLHHINKLNYLYVPTTEKISIETLNYLRPYPIGLIGINFDNEYADGYINSPLDYFYHDINHIRRFESANLQYTNKKKNLIFDDKLYKSFRIESNQILNRIDKLDNYTKKILHIIHFEFTHEFAYTPTRNDLIKALHHNIKLQSPFEHMIDDNFVEENLEKYRLANYNIISGYNEMNNNYNNKIRYYFDNGPNFIVSCYNKLNQRFYDKNIDPIEKIDFIKFIIKYLSFYNIYYDYNSIDNMIKKTPKNILEKYG